MGLRCLQHLHRITFLNDVATVKKDQPARHLSGEVQLSVAIPRIHPLADSDQVKLSDLAEEDLVMFARRVSPVYFDSITSACRASGFSPRILHVVRSVASQVAFVSCGQGIALVPSGLKKLAPANVAVLNLSDDIRVVTTAMAWCTTSKNSLVRSILSNLGIEP